MKPTYSALIFAAACAAQEHIRDKYFFYNGNTSSVPFDDPAFASAEPVATREVSFDRTLGVGGDFDPTFGRGREPIIWKWKLSVSEVALPNNTAYTAKWGFTHLHPLAAYTTHEISWPQDGNVNQAVVDETRSPPYRNESCIYHLWATLPQNVSDAWNSSSPSCRSAIGSACESYIIGSMGHAPGCDVDNRPSLYEQPTCQGAFGAATGSFVTMAYAFGNVSAPANATTFESGDRMAWTVSESYDPDNTTALALAKNRLYVMIMTNSYGTQILCNRAGDGLENERNGGGSQSGRPSVALLVIATLLAAGLGSLL